MLATKAALASGAMTHCCFRCGLRMFFQGAFFFRVLRKYSPLLARALGPVDIQRSQIIAPTKNNMAANDTTVFS
jgi:hypothetical protein